MTAPITLASRLVSSMKSIDAVTKRGKNEKQNYNYVKATDIANEVRSVLCEQGIAFTYSVLSSDRWEKTTNGGGTMFMVELLIAFSFIDQVTSETLTVQGIGWGSDSLDKAPYKAMTGALKYALRMNFLIPDEADPEATNDNYDHVEPRKFSSDAPPRVGMSKPNGKPQPTVQARAMAISDAPYDYGGDPVFDEFGDMVPATKVPPPAPPRYEPPSVKPASGPTISKAQAVRWFAFCKKYGKTDEEMKGALQSIGVKRSEEIPRDQYDTFIEWAGGQNEARA